MQQKKYEKISYATILKEPRLWLIGLAAGCSFAHYMAVASFWSVPFLMQEDHINNVYAVFINGFVLIGFTIGCPVLGIMAKFVNQKLLIFILVVIEFLALLLLNVIPHTPIIQETLLFIVGFSTANVLLTFALIREFTPTNAYGFCSGFVNMFFGLIGLILLPIIGYVFELTHKDIPLSMLPILGINFFAILCYILFLYLHKKRTIA